MTTCQPTRSISFRSLRSLSSRSSSESERTIGDSLERASLHGTLPDGNRLLRKGIANLLVQCPLPSPHETTPVSEVPMKKSEYTGPLEQVDACCWRIPKSYRPDMRVDGLIFANETLIDAVRKDQAAEQVAIVAT